jgi:hypothetical protein
MNSAGVKPRSCAPPATSAPCCSSRTTTRTAR